MKKLLSLLLALSIAPTTTAMEAPQDETSHITITRPYLHPITKKHAFHEIELFDGSNRIGTITYFLKNESQNIWSIYLFRVHRDYRESGLGTILFQHCINDIKSKNGKFLTWKASPQDTPLINRDTLIFIYKRMVNKLGFSSEALTISTPTDIVQEIIMTLQLS